MSLVLASASARRRELLAAAGFAFDVIAADIDEQIRAGEAPEDYARRMAIEKAGAVRARSGARTVVAADTIVVIDGDVLGKPCDDAEAVRMLTRLSGERHEVFTAVAVWWPDAAAPMVAIERTSVWMRVIAPDEIAAAVASGEPRDKAGAYAIQGFASRWVTRLEGAYDTVVGLPVSTVDRMLRHRVSGAYP
ncbi:MAG: septum formation inhibitor Maf [Acidobacteria bacterium]|nr:septum formation inhibitor Maf [Acidobacteriota bacterium]